MAVAAYLLGFLFVGTEGVEIIAGLERSGSVRAMTGAVLGALCLAAAAISTLVYTLSFLGLHRRPRWFAGLLGGIAAAGGFLSAVVGARLAELDVEYSVALPLLLPSLVGLLWPLLSARALAVHNTH